MHVGIEASDSNGISITLSQHPTLTTNLITSSKQRILTICPNFLKYYLVQEKIAHILQELQEDEMKREALFCKY